MRKQHSVWSPSSSGRNMACPGNLALATSLPVDDTSSVYADWGTVAHELAETRLGDRGFDLNLMVGSTDVSHAHDITIDEEMIDCVQQYVDYIESRIDDHGAELIGVEMRLTMEQLGLPIETAGTADAVLYYRALRLLELVDLKTGVGVVVEAVNNAQARTYALAALLEFTPGLKVEHIRTTIVQTRAEHEEGPIRSEEISTIELLDWVADFTDAVEAAAQAMNEYPHGDSSWAERWLHLGDHCRFCPALPICPAQRSKALATVEEFFIVSRDTPEEVEADLDRMDQVEAWIAERRALAHRMAEADPDAFKHWALVSKVGHRRFTLPPGDIAERVAEARQPFSDDLVYDKKLKSPAAMERSLGKAFVAGVLGDVIEKPSIGTDLVRREKAGKRVKVLSLTERFYQEIEQEEQKEKTNGKSK